MKRKEKIDALPVEADYIKQCAVIKETILKDMPFIPAGNVEVTHTYGIAPDQLIRSGGFMVTITNGKKGKAKRSLNIIAETFASDIMEGGLMVKIETLEKEIKSLKK
jgi:hypothetical protein